MRVDGGAASPRGSAHVDAPATPSCASRAPGPEFALEPGSAGQRIGYRLRGGASKSCTGRSSTSRRRLRADAYALVDGIARFRIAYLDARRHWRERWPVLGESAVPRAVRVELTLASGETVERWLALR